jgi:acyl carrier protein
MDNTRERVCEKLKQLLIRETSITGIDHKTKLLAAGIVDSLLILSIISYCEKEFGCVFEPNELEEQHFETIEVLADQVCRKLELGNQ